MKFKFDWFMQGMVAVVVLAFIWPEPGAHNGFLYPELLNKLGIALIFLLNGLGLSLQSLKHGVLRWPVHVLIQLATFLFFPLLGWGLFRLGGNWLTPELKTGFFYLCALPSTVSSSVALTAAARGNVPVALFNATLSSLIGVVLTPLWMAWILGQSGIQFDAWPVIVDMLIWVFLPLVLGQLARPWLGAWAARHKQSIQLVDRGTILLLVYTSFSDSVQQGIWSNYGVGMVALVMVGCLLIFGIMFGLMQMLSSAFDFSMEDRIATVFCGSKKTLASGVPMAHLIFGANPALGLILMPIMLYHPLQLALGGLLAQHWADRPKQSSQATQSTSSTSRSSHSKSVG